MQAAARCCQCHHDQAHHPEAVVQRLIHLLQHWTVMAAALFQVGGHGWMPSPGGGVHGGEQHAVNQTAVMADAALHQLVVY